MISCRGGTRSGAPRTRGWGAPPPGGGMGCTTCPPNRRRRRSCLASRGTPGRPLSPAWLSTRGNRDWGWSRWCRRGGSRSGLPTSTRCGTGCGRRYYTICRPDHTRFRLWNRSAPPCRKPDPRGCRWTGRRSGCPPRVSRSPCRGTPCRGHLP